MQFFPDDHPHYGLRYILDNIGDPKLKEDTDKWYSEYEDLMEYRRNPIYGRTKVFSMFTESRQRTSKNIPWD